MLTRLLLALLLTLASTSIAFAQRRPGDQFYANDDGVYGWSTEEKKDIKTKLLGGGPTPIDCGNSEVPLLSKKSENLAVRKS